jgi:NADH-quinone oxidoreductase subunit J
LGEAIVFYILAGAMVAGAIFTLTRRNPVGAVMSLVATFFATAGLYATLSAHFVAVLQVAVYAGAIMVLFIFVVMILNREEVEIVSFKGILTRALGVVASGFGILWLVGLAVRSKAGPLATAPAAVDDTFGTVAAVGMSLFRDFVFPFEAISLLLLVAIVGGVIVSRSAKQEEEAEETARKDAVIRKAIREETRLGIGPATDAHEKDHGHAPAHH